MRPDAHLLLEGTAGRPPDRFSDPVGEEQVADSAPDHGEAEAADELPHQDDLQSSVRISSLPLFCQVQQGDDCPN